jgi:nucleolar protein 4
MDDTVKRGGTLFVSNVNYDTTSADLEAAFSNLAPVRSAFVVSAKGVGYVTLAISEDASRVLEAVKSDGLVVNGRALRADWADARKKRPHTEEDSSAPREAPPPDKKPRLVVHDRDPDATRSIVLLNLPSSVDQKQLWKKARKYAAESVVHPFLADQTMGMCP